MLFLCVNKLQWSCLHWYIVPGSTVVSLLSYSAHCLQGHTSQTPTESLWGVVLLVSPVGQLCLDQISFGPLPHQKIQHGWYPYQCQESCMLGRFVVVWIRCSNTVFPMKTMCTHEMMWRQMHRPTQISKALGRISFCCNVKFWYLHGGWFLFDLKLYLGGTGASLSAWSLPSVGSMLVSPINPKLNGTCCFDGELGMPSSWLSVGWSTGNVSFLCGTGVSSSLDPSPPTEFSPYFCSRLLLVGNR